MWGESASFNNAPDTYRIFFEAIGGQGTGGVVGSPDGPNAPGTSGAVYSIYQTPDAEGKIEIRLHLHKFRWCTYSKLILINGYFDDFSVTY
jgi:hypothetical protein